MIFSTPSSGGASGIDGCADAGSALAGVFPADWPPARREGVAGLLKGNLLLPEDATGWLAVLSGDLPALEAAEKGVVAEAGPEFFHAALAAYTETGADLGRLAREMKTRTGRKGAGLFMPLRLALTGRHDGPELAALLPAIPEALVRARLESAARMDRD